MTSETETPRINARWTDDCQGKKDFDGPIVDISTRYWPRGGGFHFSTGRGDFQSSADAFPQVKPSAHSSIRILRRDEDGEYGEGDDLLSASFEADTEDEVKAQVEAWAAEQYARIGRALRAEFAAPEGSV